MKNALIHHQEYDRFFGILLYLCLKLMFRNDQVHDEL